MRFSVATVLAFASAVLAQTAGFDVISKPSDQEKIPAGKQYEIVWAPTPAYSGKTVSIILIGGPTQPEQQVLKTIVTGIPSDSGKFSWAVDEDLGDKAVYGLKLVLDEKTETFQFSFPFHITASEHDGHSSAPASSSATKSAPVTSTYAPSSKSTTGYPVNSESSTLSSSTISYGNLSSTVSVPSGTATESVPASTTASSTGKATTSAVATGAAGAYAANGIAVLGGFAMAVLAL